MTRKSDTGKREEERERGENTHKRNEIEAIECIFAHSTTSLNQNNIYTCTTQQDIPFVLRTIRIYAVIGNKHIYFSDHVSR